MELWIQWIEKNIPHFQDKLFFGKYEGIRLWLIDKDYIIWLYDNVELYDKELEHKIGLLSKIYDKNKLIKRFLDPIYDYSLGTLIYIYRKINKDEKWLPPLFRKNVILF
jgi:hypothetical protein